MKPFNLEAAKRGEPIVTRDGRPVKFVTHVPEARDTYRLVCDLEGFIRTFCEDGSYSLRLSPNDLFMAPPPMRSINGHEYPEPVREPLEDGQEYWIVAISTDSLFYKLQWNGYSNELRYLKRGLIHLTPEAAEAHARAIILAGGGEV